MKETWSSTRGGGGSITFVGAKKRSANNKEINTLFALAVDTDMKPTKKSKAKSKDASDSEDEAEHFNFEN